MRCELSAAARRWHRGENFQRSEAGGAAVLKAEFLVSGREMHRVHHTTPAPSRSSSSPSVLSIQDGNDRPLPHLSLLVRQISAFFDIHKTLSNAQATALTGANRSTLKAKFAELVALV